MATINKDFKIKSGLIVEGTTATVNGYNILTEAQAGIDFIVNQIGGTSTSENTPDTVVKRDGTGSFAAQDITLDGTLNANNIVNSSGVTITADNGDIVLDADGWVYAGGTNASDRVATRGRVDALIGDETVDSSTGNTVTDRIQSAANDAAYTAEFNAKAYADGLAGNYDAAGAATTAENNAKSYADGLAVNYDAAGAATSAQTAAENYADDLISTEVTNRNNAIATAKSEAITVAEGYTDTAVANLVDGAPALLDTLNELAAAIADNPNYATDVANLVADKADTSYVNQEISDLDTAAQGYANTAQTNAENYATQAAEQAENNAKSYADGLAVNYDASGAAATAEQNASSYAETLNETTNIRIDNLSTSGVSEGVNQYFTDSRAKDSAADLLTGANLTNITITGSGSGLTITAENGVANSTTSDLAEGSNLYFTDQRVLDAASNAAQVEVQALDITWVRREEATYNYVASASTAVVHTFPNWEGSAKYLVRVQNNGKSHLTELLATTDSSNNVAVVEYGTIYTSENPLATATVEWNAGANQYELKVTTANNSSEVLVAATLIAYGD